MSTSRGVPARTVVRVRRIPVFYIWVSTCLLLGVNFYQINLLQKEKSELKKRALKTEIQADKQKLLNSTPASAAAVRLLLDRSILDQPQRFYLGPGTSIVKECGAPLTLRPENMTGLGQHADRTQVWPSFQRATGHRNDRIIAQMQYVPSRAQEYKAENKEKLIYVVDDLLYNGDVATGNSRFKEDECPVNTCNITGDSKLFEEADAVLLTDIYSVPDSKRGRHLHNQVWVYYNLESPENTYGTALKNYVNWTATYRRDSTLVTPYEKFVPYEDSEHELPLRTEKNYAEGKTKMVAWFVSNCHPSNKRDKYAKELAKYVDVDIYGRCGRKSCPRDNSTRCDEMLNEQYKFYLSFENSNCQDYITEKFFRQGLSNDVVPIVMGAKPEEYARVAPPGSYIHVDDFRSPRDLAHYLKILNADDDLYNEYFRWKGSGSFINTKFWCRLCAMLHDASRLTWYRNFNSWWNPPGMCVGDSNWSSRWKT